MRADLYRLCCIRYIYLIFLGYVWAARGIRLNKWTVSLSILSLVFISIFRYTGQKLEPIFFFSVYAWEDCHWICYYYPAFLFMHILHWAFTVMPQRVKAVVTEIGHYSWQIFLMQMFFFSMFPRGSLMSLGNYFVTVAVYSAMAFTFSIVPVLIVYRYNGKFK